jgi:hypothetical protein
MHGQWVNYLYHYGVGGSFFLFSMWMLFKGGALKWESASDRFVTKGLLVGLLSFALIHAIWIWKAI